MKKLFNKSDKKDVVSEKVNVNEYLISKIQPQGNLSFSDDKCVRKGDGYEACIQIYEYPSLAYDFWLSDVMNIDGVITILDIATENIEKVREDITSSLSTLDVTFGTDREDTTRMDAQNDYQMLQEIYNQVKQNGEVIKLIQTRIYVSGKTKQEVEEKCADIIGDLEGKNYRSAVYLNETKFQYKAIFTPYKEQIDFSNKRTGNPIPAFSLAGGYPFNYEHLSDPRGMYVGTTVTGGSIILDLFHKSKQRLSYDALIIGKKGSGKSTTLKLMMENNAIVGNYIRGIDVAGEFTDLALKLGGKVITMDGTQGIINYLEVYKIDEDEKVSFAKHLSKLNSFYKFLSPTATSDECNEFESFVRKLYIERGLWNVSEGKDYEQKITGLIPEAYPTFSNLLSLIQSELYSDIEEKIINQKISSNRVERLESIELHLDNLINNYGFMFDGHTSIPNLTEEQILIFNVQNIATMKDEIFNPLLFNILSLLLDDMVTIGSRSKRMFESGTDIANIPKILMLIDEAHRIISPKNPLALDHMIYVVREGRKFFTGLLFASQSIRDFAPENSESEVLEKIKVLFELTQYKFIMQQDPNSLNLMRNIFEGELTESELIAIPKFEQGEVILSITGLETLHFYIDVTKEELELFKGGL